MITETKKNRTIEHNLNEINVMKHLSFTIILGSVIYIVSQLAGLILTNEEFGPIVEGGNSSKFFITSFSFFLLALIGITILTRGRMIQTRYGLTKSSVEIKWGSLVGLGLLIGSVATIIIIITGASGNPSLSGLNISQKIILIWFLASISEEVFIRGLLQGYLSPLIDRKIFLSGFEVSFPVAFSTFFFGLIHLPLILFGADLITVVVIFCMTLILGYFAASVREKSLSLFPSIIIHTSTNIGGTMLGSIVYAIFTGSIGT